jgi:hypothetical protein
MSRVAGAVESPLSQSLMALLWCQYACLVRTSGNVNKDSWQDVLDRLSSYRTVPRHQRTVNSYARTWLFLVSVLYVTHGHSVLTSTKLLVLVQAISWIYNAACIIKRNKTGTTSHESYRTPIELSSSESIESIFTLIVVFL